jgi:hypothetical protein
LWRHGLSNMSNEYYYNKDCNQERHHRCTDMTPKVSPSSWTEVQGSLPRRDGHSRDCRQDWGHG